MIDHLCNGSHRLMVHGILVMSGRRGFLLELCIVLLHFACVARLVFLCLFQPRHAFFVRHVAPLGRDHFADGADRGAWVLLGDDRTYFGQVEEEARHGMFGCLGVLMAFLFTSTRISRCIITLRLLLVVAPDSVVVVLSRRLFVVVVA